MGGTVRVKGLWSRIIPGLGRAGDEKTKMNIKPRIDYPQADEKVSCGHYAIRISGCEGECQITIDGTGVWENCRRDGGYCWYDWNPAGTGAHRISIRARVGNQWVKEDRTCRVV